MSKHPLNDRFWDVFLMAKLAIEIQDPMMARRIKRVGAYCEWLLKEAQKPAKDLMRWEDDGGACNS